jgi:serine/threonine protein kinase
MTLPDAGYKLAKKVGKGNQSTAYSAQHHTGKRVCIKHHEKAKMSPADVDGLKAEYDMLRKLEAHANITRVYDLFQDDSACYMVQALHEGGDFTTLRQRVSASYLTESYWRGIFRQCLEGIAHLHHNGVMHCDLKESNLMIKQSSFDYPEVALIDFGLFRTTKSVALSVSGTAGYIAPEVWDTGRYQFGGDMFAIGVVMMQMVLDQIPAHHNPPPFEVIPGGIFTKGIKTLREAAAVVKTRAPPFEQMPEDMEGLTDVLRRLLHKKVSQRPSASACLDEPWFEVEEEETDERGCTIS